MQCANFFLQNTLKKVQLIASRLSAYSNDLVYNAVYNACLHNAVCCFIEMLFVCIMLFYIIFAIDFCKSFLFSCFVLVY